MSLLGGLLGIGGGYSSTSGGTAENTVNMEFTSQLATYLNEPDAMSKDAREAFEDAAKEAYDAAKDAAKAVRDEAKDAKDATEDHTAERVAAEAVYEAAKDDYDDLRDLGLDDWMQEVYAEMTAAQAAQAAQSGGSGQGAAVSGSGVAAGGGGGAHGGGQGTPVDQSGIRAVFSREYPAADPDAERAQAIAVQARISMASLVEELGSHAKREATEYADVPRTRRGPAATVGAALNRVA